MIFNYTKDAHIVPFVVY